MYLHQAKSNIQGMMDNYDQTSAEREELLESLADVREKNYIMIKIYRMFVDNETNLILTRAVVSARSHRWRDGFLAWSRSQPGQGHG